MRAAPADHLQVQINGSPTAGVATTVTVAALDGSDAVDTGYTGTVHFTSNDGQAVLPADYLFDIGDNGVQTFSLTFRTAGNRSISVADVDIPGINGNDSTTVNPAAAHHLVVSGFPDPTVAGASHPFVVTAKDLFGNTATGYSGTVTFTSTDPDAVLPIDYDFVGGDNGDHTFSATLKTAGNPATSPPPTP